MKTSNSDYCLSCPTFILEKQRLLIKYNSAYDAAIEALHFTTRCKKTCDLYTSTKENKDGRKDCR